MRVQSPCGYCGAQIIHRPNESPKFCGRSCLAKDKLTRPEIRAILYSDESRAKLSRSLTAHNASERGRAQRSRRSAAMTGIPLSPEVIEKTRETKRRKGTLNVWLGRRGGNGQFTQQQQKLYDALTALSQSWEREPVIRTQRKWPWPHKYQPDIGRYDQRICVEVDGRGHRLKRAIEIDAKKTECLNSLGWSVLRFTNKDVDGRLDWVMSVIAAECGRRSSTT